MEGMKDLSKLQEKTSLEPWPPAGIKWYYSDDAVCIAHADCRDILPLIPDKSIDLVLTDPPYGVGFAEWDNGKIDVTWLELLKRFESLILVTTGITNMFDYPKPNWIVSWSYPNGEKRSKGGGINCWEPILVYGKNPFMLDHKHFRPRAFDSPKDFPCPKPIEPWQWLILGASKEGNIILDPFLGSGTTAYCAKKLGRKCIGIEIEEKYCEIAVNRLRQSVMKL